MTKPRDDGYLETDDPLVAACFIGKAVRFQVEPNPDDQPVWGDGWLHVVSDYVPGFCGQDKYGLETGGDTILIPASVVAEVFFASELAMKVIVMAIDNEDTLLPTYEVVRWLLQHKGKR
jgi:hypothetical protein